MAIRVPDTREEALSPSWLSAALAPRFPGIRVTKVEPGTVVSRVSTNICFRIECEGGVPEGLSPNLCVKGYFDLPSRAGGISETAFYRDVGSAIDVRTLRCVYADIDPDTEHGVILTEDVVADGGTFLDALSPYSPDQVAESLAQLAKLHAGAWCAPKWADVPWLASRMAGRTTRRGEPEIRGNFEGPIGAGVPDEARDARRLLTAYRALAAEVETAREWTVIHGDPHIGNLFLDGEGRPSFVDWQLVQRAPWYIDVGYHIASALSVENRRKSEGDLLRHYLDHLAAGGVDAPAFDDARNSIRKGIVAGFFLWGITLKVKPELTTELLTRIGTAAADHDALASVTS